MHKVCIVTPDIIGPIKNGGIGTHCYWLAKLYAARPDHLVTVLFTSPWEDSYNWVIDDYADSNIEFVPLSCQGNPSYNEYGLEWFGQRAARVHDYFRDNHFDVIHFQDWQANGFECIRTKRLGLGFQNTVLITTLHSPTRWSRDGTNEWSAYPTGDCKLHYAERYACEHADILVSPTQHMFDWAATKGWTLPNDHRVISCVFPRGLAAVRRVVPIDATHLVFFGRLETRKGLEVFCGAIRRLIQSSSDHGIERLTFLGKCGDATGMDGIRYVQTHTATAVQAGIEVEVIADFDALQAGQFLRESGAIAVIPSLVDNHPYTVVECLEMGIPVMASNVGGIPELVSSEVLFEPVSSKLAEAILERSARLAKMRQLYDGARAAKLWGQLTQEAIHGHVNVKPRKKTECPLVSVCVAHYNHGTYLPQLLRSLALNDYPNLEVVVVDDGSTDPQARASLHHQERMYKHLGWKFFTKPNGGPGSARNVAAEKAVGHYIVFMDADNIAKRHMISTFVRAIQHSGAHCLTCHMAAFIDDAPTPESLNTPFYTYAPLGPCLEVGQVENVFGDTNFIMKRKDFVRSGGFSTGHGSGDEDWEFLARLALDGLELDVVPEPLFHYRHRDDSFSRQHNAVAGRRRVAAAFANRAERLDMDMVVNHILAPMHHISSGLGMEIRALQQMIGQRDARIEELEKALNDALAPNAAEVPSRNAPSVVDKASLLKTAQASIVSSFQVALSRRAVRVQNKKI